MTDYSISPPKKARHPTGAFFLKQVGILLIAAFCSTAEANDLLKMAEQLDKLDGLDFQAAVDTASTCIGRRDYACAEAQLVKAGKAAGSAKDREVLQSTRQKLANERQLEREEIAAREAEQRRVAERERAEERRLALAEERRERLREEREERMWREARDAREEEISSSPRSSGGDSIGAYILRKGAENATLLSKLNRQTDAAVADTNRRIAQREAEQDRMRNEREVERRQEVQRAREQRESALEAERAAERRERRAEASQASEMTQRGSATAKRTEAPAMGPIQKEAVAICRQAEGGKGWSCNGPLDDQIIFDEPSLESALARQGCAGALWAAGGPTIKGQKWEAYRCGHAIDNGDYDIVKRYGLVTAQRSYQCSKSKPYAERCTQTYGSN